MNVLSVDSQELSEHQLKVLYTIGDMLSISIERARLFENSKQIGVAEERNRLAREIHDTLAQGLTAISLKLETVAAFMEVGKLEKANQLIAQSLDLTRMSLAEARLSVLDLRAASLQENDLINAIKKLLKESLQDQKINYHFSVDGQQTDLALRTEMGLYRIVQEGIQNIIKHANANNAWVKLEFFENKVVLKMKDDGVGFDVNQNKTGFGLIGINERCKLLNGSFEIKQQFKERNPIEN